MPHLNKFVRSKKYSLYAYGAKGNNLIRSACYESISVYMARKFITRSTVKTFVRKGWLAILRVKGRLWVHEVCPDEIENYLL